MRYRLTDPLTDPLRYPLRSIEISVEIRCTDSRPRRKLWEISTKFPSNFLTNSCHFLQFQSDPVFNGLKNGPILCSSRACSSTKRARSHQPQESKEKGRARSPLVPPSLSSPPPFSPPSSLAVEAFELGSCIPAERANESWHRSQNDINKAKERAQRRRTKGKVSNELMVVTFATHD